MEGEQVRKYNPRGLSEHNVMDIPNILASVAYGELHEMKVDEFQLCKGDNGGQTKTRQGGFHTKLRNFQLYEYLPLVQKDAQ